MSLVELSPDPEPLGNWYLALGVELEKSNDYDSAAEIYRKGIECGPKESDTRYFLHNNLGYCLNQLGKHAEADGFCRAAIEIEPWRYNAYKNLGVALQGLGTYPEAAVAFLQAAIAFPYDPRSFAHLAALLANHRDIVEREIPDIDEQIAFVIEVRGKVMQ